MKQLKNIFFALALVAVGASAASAQVQFFVSASGARPLRSEGTTEAVGTVAFASNNTGNIVFDSIITLDYGTTVLGAAGATVSTTCRLAGAATLATSVVGSVLTLKVTGTVAADFLACANGNSITVTAARVNASALGSGASVNVAVGASVPAAFQSTNAVTLISVGTLTVGQVQSGLSTATTINPGITTNNFLLCNVSDGDSEDVKVMIEENFPGISQRGGRGRVRPR